MAVTTPNGPKRAPTPSKTLTPSTDSRAATIDDDDADALENAVFQEKHGLQSMDKDFQSTCIDALLCCVRSRCLTLTCVLLPCLLFLFIALVLPSATKKTAKRVLFILSGVPPATYILCGVLLVCCVCCRQVSLDTKNAQAAHKYMNARHNLKKIAVTAGRSSTEITVAGRIALFLRAAKSNDVDNFQWCLDNGQEVDEVDHLGRSALHWAALSGSDEIVSVLLRNGASIDLQDTLEGLSPLHYAAYYGHIKVVRLLVNAGASLTLKDKRKMNPLQLAEMASLKMASVQPSHQMITKFLRIAMKDEATPPLQHTMGLTVVNLVERQMMALPQAAD